MFLSIEDVVLLLKSKPGMCMRFNGMGGCRQAIERRSSTKALVSLLLSVNPEFKSAYNCVASMH